MVHVAVQTKKGGPPMGAQKQVFLVISGKLKVLEMSLETAVSFQKEKNLP